MVINITGFTAPHNNTARSNSKNIIGLSNLLKTILEDNGYIVDFNLKGADLNIVFVFDLSSPNVAYYEQALDLLQKENCIIAFDDWSIKNFYKTIDKILTGDKVFKTHFHIKQNVIDKYIDVIRKIADGKYRVLYPAYKAGNHELLEIRGDKFFIDPSIYIKKDIPPYTKGELMPVHASLADKSWVKKIGWPVIDLKNVTEDEVFKNYCEHRMILSPPHYHDTSGWFRNRYTLAQLSNAVVVEDSRNIFGDSYRKLKIEDVNEGNIDTLFAKQKKDYENNIMSKEEISKILKEYIR